MSRYSIVLPVRNGGAYVKECVNSILNQSFPDFNLLVLDNCSTDGTLEWLKTLPDERIRIYPAAKPLTIEENWKRITTVPKNEFITLIGHDDYLEKNYLETMDRLIGKHPAATLYQAHYRYIDSTGHTIRPCKPMDEVQSGTEFLACILLNTIDVMGTGFLMRSADYDAIGGIPDSYPNLLFADFELFVNLAVKGYKATAFDECFTFRLHQSTTTTSADIKLQQSFGLFMAYLENLKGKNDVAAEVIKRYATDYIQFYCKSLAHRLLRTPRSKRGTLTVARFINECKVWADRLVPGNSFYPHKKFTIKIARQIDDSFLLRSLFLLFKKAYPRPVYQS